MQLKSGYAGTYNIVAIYNTIQDEYYLESHSIYQPA